MILLAWSIIFVDFSSSLMFPLNLYSSETTADFVLLCFLFLVVIAFHLFFFLSKLALLVFIPNLIFNGTTFFCSGSGLLPRGRGLIFDL